MQYIILGIVQGITELLPISSTAHLALVPWFLGWKDPGLSLTVALHGGTLLAVLIYFWKDWLRMASGVLHIFSGTQGNEQKLFLRIAIATIPAMIGGVLLEHYADTVFRAPLLMAGALAGFSFVMIWAEKKGKQTIASASNISWQKAVFIGLMQTVAIIPGVSRSGSTISGGLFAGLKREEAARFSFLLSAPIVAGALLFMLPDFVGSGMVDSNFFAGFLASFLSGVAAIAFLMRFLQHHTLWIFVWYRLGLAAFILATLLIRG